MELQSILQADYLDIIFDKRNKKYGAYELRRHYDQRAIKATLIVFSLLLLAIGLHSFVLSIRPAEVIRKERVVVIEPSICNFPLPKPKIEIPVPKASTAPLVKPTVANPPPKITPDELVDKVPPTVADLKGKESGKVDAKGDPNGIVSASTSEPGHGLVPGTIEPPAPAEKIETYVDQMPEFNGSINEYLGKNIRYPEAAKDMHIEGRVAIKFVVNEDGSISNARILRSIGGGCEEEALRVINSMPRWKPGKLNGKPVKVYFTVPVSFVLK